MVSAERKVIRVCFPFVGGSVGGSHMSGLLLIEGLDRNRYEPVVIVHEEGALAEHLESRNIPFTLLPLPAYAGQSPRLTSIAAAMLRTAPRLIRFLKRENIDIVHGNDFRINLTWGAAAKLAGRRAIWHQRALPYSSSSLWRAVGFLSDHVIYISKAVSDRMNTLHRTPSSTIANPIAAPQGLPSRNCAKAAIANEFAFDPGATVIGFVGRLVDWKRPDVFLSAAARLAQCDTHRQWAFVMVGHDEANLVPELSRLAKSLGIGNQTFFAGFRHRIENWVAGMDLLLAPSSREPFGRTLVESMVMGTPVVAARAGGHIEIIEDGRTGLLVTPDDPKAFAAAARRLITDPGFAGKLAEEARAHAIDEYSVSMHVSRVMSVYDQLMPTQKRLRESLL